LLSAIVKRLTPEGQPQLLDRGAALSPLVVRGGDVEVEVCDPAFVDPERVRFNSLSRAAHVVDQKHSRVPV